MKKILIDLIGQRFGKLVVVSRGEDYSNPSSKRVRHHPRWVCVCDCGKQTLSRACDLRSGKSHRCRSCADKFRSSHGQAGKTVEYRTWVGMRYRCRKVGSQMYENYGGRGITVCDRWNSFENFLSDMGNRPKGMSLDRIDVNGNYEPGNCRWATAATQTENRRVKRIEDFSDDVIKKEFKRRFGLGDSNGKEGT